jgi:Organic solvent tolerance protein OstA
MPHFSIRILSIRMRHRAAVVGFALLLLALACQSTAQTPNGAPDPAPQLKSSPVLEPPPPKALRLAPGANPLAPEREPIFLRADKLEGDNQQWIEASGHAELRSRRQTVLADWLRYDIPIDQFWAKGNVILRRGVDRITGPEAKFKRSDETGFFTSPEFHIGENASRGDAKELTFVGPNQYELKDVRYTTCVAGNDDWYLTSSTVDVDRTRLVGTAHNATILFKNVPILYSPYIDFPLSNERKSGFLAPLFGSTSSRGIEMSLPYYLNLAPNYDATLTPRFMTRRGLQLNGQFRYLFPDITGEADAEILPDRITNTNRYGLTWKHTQAISQIPGLATYVNVQKVSDDAYFTDLSDRLIVTSQQTLPREAGLSYNRGPFGFLARVQAFQTLQDPNNPITPPYFREPQLLATMNPVEWKGIDFAGNAEYVRFRQPALLNAERAVVYPTATWTTRGNAWFVAARAGLHLSHYDFADDSAVEEKHLNRAVPITSLDGGLVFERETNMLGHDYTQTLEPRAFYVYIPYRRQEQIPAFDTAIDDFNFSQLFTENRYLGNDRIGDANQVTFAVTSRLLDPMSGDERARFSIGQRYYFQSQRVTLTEAPRSANTSDLLLSGEGRLSDYWSAAGTLQYSINHPQTQLFDIGVRWQPAPGKVLNASYRYIRQNIDPTGSISQLKQVDFSGQWPLSNQWSFIGRWNYSLVDAKTLEGVLGFEYNGDCWAFRIVGQRLTTTTEQASKSVFVQFELNGLARLGTNPIDVLKRSVPGYLTGNEPSMRPPGGTVTDYFPEF